MLLLPVQSFPIVLPIGVLPILHGSAQVVLFYISLLRVRSLSLIFLLLSLQVVSLLHLVYLVLERCVCVFALLDCGLLRAETKFSINFIHSVMNGASHCLE